jgi:hypothetical protein
MGSKWEGVQDGNSHVTKLRAAGGIAVITISLEPSSEESFLGTVHN